MALFRLHNASLARFAEIWGNDPRREGPAPYHLSSEGTNYEIRLAEDSDFTAGFFDEAISADAIKGKGVKDIRRPGLGAPLVGVRYHTEEREEEMQDYPPQGVAIHACHASLVGHRRRHYRHGLVPVRHCDDVRQLPRA